MKRKYILVAAALAVLCAGAAAYSMNQNTELPSDAPNSSSADSSVASSEPESGSTSVTDNRDIAKAENFVTYQVFSQESTSTDTGAGETQSAEEIQALENEALSKPEDEELIQKWMSEYNMTREEAESELNSIKAEQEEGKKQEAEEKAAEEAKVNAWIAERNQKCLEETGMSFEEFSRMKAKDYYAWTQAHPDVDLSFMQGYEG